MGKKAGRPQDAREWQRETAQRLTRQRQQLSLLGASSKAPPPGQPSRIVMPAADVPPLALPDSPRSELRALVIGKNQPADFLPQRNLYMVRGRPVLVTSALLDEHSRLPPAFASAEPSASTPSFFRICPLVPVPFAPGSGVRSPMPRVMRARVRLRVAQSIGEPSAASFICGVSCCNRCPRTQVLVLTYEGTRVEDAGTYLAELFAPAPVLLAFGRYYKAAPACGKEWSVRCWWEDPGARRLMSLLSGRSEPSARRPWCMPSLSSHSLQAMVHAIFLQSLCRHAFRALPPVQSSWIPSQRSGFG